MAHKDNITPHSYISPVQTQNGVIAINYHLNDPDDYFTNHHRHFNCSGRLLSTFERAFFDPESPLNLQHLPGKEVFALNLQMEAKIASDFYAHTLGLVSFMADQAFAADPDCPGLKLSFDVTHEVIGTLIHGIQSKFPGLDQFNPQKDEDYFAIPKNASWLDKVKDFLGLE